MNDRENLLNACAEFLTGGGLRRLHLCLPQPLPEPETPELTCHAFSVLQIVLSGKLPFVFAGVGGRIVRTVIREGEGYFSLPWAWNSRTYTNGRRMLMVRFLEGRQEYALSRLLADGSRQRGWEAWQEVDAPLPSAAAHLLQALQETGLSAHAQEQSEALAALTGNALLEISRLHLAGAPAAGRAQLRWRRIAACLEEPGREPLRRAELARLFRLTPDHLTRLFRQHAGMSFAEYACRLRIDRARHLLATTELSVKEVARHCGFHDSSYFVKVFKKFIGHTPGRGN